MSVLDYIPFLGEGPDIPLGPLSNLFQSSTQPPILPRLPNAYRAYNNKYADPNLQSMLSRLDPSIRNSLLNFDQTRVLRGQNPLSTNQTIGAVQSVVNQQPATAPEDQGFFGNVMSDLRTMLDIPHVISGLANEVRSLPEAPGAFQDVLDKANGNLGDIIGGFQEVPGLRDIPGVYTLSNLFGGRADQIYQHPLFTGLDVLPYAKAPLSDLANRAVMWNPETAARVERFRPSVDELTALNQARDIAGEAPKPMPSNLQLAFASNPYVQALSGTETIQKIGQLVGNESRDVSQLGERWLRTMRAWMDPATAEDHPLLHTADGQILAPLRGWFKEINDYRNTIPTMRRQELTNMLEHRNYDDIIQETPLSPEEQAALAATNKRIGDINLTDTERGFVQAARTIPEAIANYAIEHNLGLDRVGQDVYPSDIAGQIRNAELQRQTQQNVLQARDRVADATPGLLPRDLNIPAFAWEHQPEAASRMIGHAYADAIDLSGFDASAIRSALAQPTLDRDAVSMAIRDTLANPTERPILSRQEILDKFAPEVEREKRGVGNTYTRINQYAQDGDWQKAADLYQRTVHIRGPGIHPDDAILLDSMKRYRDAGKRLTTLGKTYTDKTLTAANEAEAYVKRTNIPARFTPAIEAATKTQLINMFPADAESISKGLYSKVKNLDKDAYDQALHEAIDFIEEQRNRGFDPTYVHRVNPSSVNEIKYPRLSDVAKRMSQEKSRTLDPTPYIHDAAIGVSHQLAEVMNQRAVRGFIEQFINAHKVDMSAINAEFQDQAARLHALNPELDERAYIEKLQKRKYVQYDPHDIFPVNQIKLRQSAEFFPDEETWITRNANETLKRLFRDSKFERNFAQWDPLMNAFRYSVLAFSPRNQVNNIGGGMLLAAMEDPRILWNSLRQFNVIRKMIKEDTLQAIPSMPPSGYGTVGGEIKDFEANAGLADRVLAAQQYAGGATRRRWLQEFYQSVPGKKDGLFSGIRKAADRMYAINNYVDEWLRSAGYLTGFNSELNKVFKDQVAKGLMTEEEATRQAQQAGVALVRKFMPNWDRATPFERNVMRTVFPFYNFSRFLVGYALHYPIDHPFRVAVMGQLVRNEYEKQEWLPERFQSMFFIGHPDSFGNVRAFSPGGINPFTDVANYFSTAGFLGKVNPVLSGILESVGIDPSKGSQDLYPDISVNPVTGTLQPKNINLFSAIFQNLVPQTQVIGALIGRNNDFNAILRTNPEAAATWLRSGMGLSTPWRNINPAQEGFKEELNRQANAQTVRNEALRTGNWDRAMHFPSLVPFFTRLNQVFQSNPQLLQQYRAASQQGVGDTFLNALIGAAVPTG